ncbi:MAG: D-alanine--D-alanine ligase [Bacteroidia bacterium]|nr:D-alanine--D-alanine ligase [Bacteroidia bacterium]
MIIKRIAVLFGGRSGEHEVSLVSAQSVMNALDPAKFDVIPVGIDKRGRWWTGDGALELLRSGAGDCTPCTLPPEPGRGLLLFDEAGAHQLQIDAIFPVLHGTYGEDGCMQGLFELAGIPYVGAGVAGSAVAMDKVLQKRLHRESGLPVAEFLSFPSSLVLDSAEDIAPGVIEALGLPVFVKPPNLGSSVGISKATTEQELVAGMRLAAEFDTTVLVEHAVQDAREIEVAVLGNEQPIASVAGEIVPGNEFYDYDAKYVDGNSQLHIPAEMDTAFGAQLRDMAVRAFTALSLEGMARVDFLLSRSTGELIVNEVNTIPGFTSISMYPKLFEASGVPYPELLEQLIDLAIERHARISRLRREYTPKTDWHNANV